MEVRRGSGRERERSAFLVAMAVMEGDQLRTLPNCLLLFFSQRPSSRIEVVVA